LWKHQYTLLICEFLLNGLTPFMENLKDKEYVGEVAIVYGKDQAHYSHLLGNLIHQYSGYQVVEMTEKAFSDNAHQIDTNQKIIFLGKTITAKERAAAVIHKYNNFGMNYGFMGNHPFIHVTTLKAENWEAFQDYYIEKSVEYEEQARKFVEREVSDCGRTAGAIYGSIGGATSGVSAASTSVLLTTLGSARFVFGLPGIIIGTGLGLGAGYMIDKVLTRKAILEDLDNYQHELLLREFVFN